MSAASSFDAAAAISDQKARAEKYAELLERLIAESDVEGLKIFVEHSAQRLKH